MIRALQACTSPQPAYPQELRSSCPPLETSDLFVCFKALFPARALGQRYRVQHGRALVAQDCERASDRAGGLVLAVAARRVEIDAGARDQRNRAFHRTDDLAERNIARR